MYTFILCLVVILTGFLYIYLSNNIGCAISFVLFCISSAITLFVLLKMTYKFLKMIRMRMNSLIHWISKKTCRKGEEEIPIIEGLDDFIQLAKKMNVKLNKKNPFKKVRNLDNIGADLFERRIILGDKLFDRLNHAERLAVVAHELAHFKMVHAGVQLASMLLLWVLMVLFLPQAPESMLLLLISFFMQIVALFLGFSVSSYLCEYWADCVAVGYTKNKEAFISALQELDSSDKWDFEYVTHPSINSRVARLNMKANYPTSTSKGR